MIRMTIDVPDELADRIRPLSPWLPTVLEFSLAGFRTQASATATEVIRFLSTEPSPEAIGAFHISQQSQERLQRLLALNEAGLLSESEVQELDELQRIEHIMIMLKVRVLKESSRDANR